MIAESRLARLLSIPFVLSTAPALGAQTQTALRDDDAPQGSLLERRAKLDVQSVTLGEALTRLTETSGVIVVFSPSLLSAEARTVTCDCRDHSVGEALDLLLADTRFRYSIMDGQVALIPNPFPSPTPALAKPRLARLTEPCRAGAYSYSVPRPLEAETSKASRHRLRRTYFRSLKGAKMWKSMASLLSCVAVASVPLTASAQQGGTVIGLVEGSDGRPLPGATVAVTAMEAGTLAGEDGGFVIQEVPPGSHELEAAMIGYSADLQTVTVTAGDTVSVNFSLAPQAIALDEIVAIGYGTQQRRILTGAVSSVGGEDALTRAAPNVNLASALQGRTAGVHVVSNSGRPGGGVSIRIRGSNSISANSEPLYVIDGLPVAEGDQGTGNPLRAIDTSEIESIEILKDAASTAIYGARGANGVILVTTRRGSPAQNVVSLETSYGVQTAANRIEVLNGPEFMEFVNESRTNANLTPIHSAEDIANAPTFDYMDAILRDARQMNHAVSVSGGDDRTRYLVGVNYMQQQGIMKQTEFNRAGLRLNLDRDVSERFRIGTSLNFAQVAEHDPGNTGTAWDAAMLYHPYVLPVDEEGVPNRNLLEYGITGGIGDNPVTQLEYVTDNQHEWRGIGSLFAEYDLTSALRFRSSFGLNFRAQRSGTYNASESDNGFGVDGTASTSNRQFLEWTSDNLLTWRRPDLGPGNLELLGGYSIQKAESQTYGASGETFPDDVLQYYSLGTAGTSSVSSNYTDATLVSFLARGSYNLLDRYVFTVTARRDGSTRFGAQNQWAFFPSAAFAWLLSDEDFMRDQGLFSDLRLRLSYGRTGNQAISAYETLPSLSTQFYGFGTSPIEHSAMQPSAAGNPELKWETQAQANVGVDIGFFDNRIALTIDAYQSLTSDLLLTVQRPYGTGFASQLQNVGSVRNRGIEAALSTVNVERNRFGWRSSLNISLNRNEIRSLSGDTDEIIDPGPGVTGLNGGTSVIRVGKPLGAIYGIETDGLYQQGDPCQLARTASCAPGEINAIDRNGDGQVDLDDRIILGYGDPKLYGGFNNELRYGPVSLLTAFNFSYGNKIANLPLRMNMLARGIANERKEVLDRWRPTNTDATIPRANNARESLLYDFLVEDGSYLRLQSLTLGYRLPERLLPGTTSARLFLTGQNVWTLTGYRGFDPEVNARGGNSAVRGIDFRSYPRARSWNIGANVTF